ncbi:ArnT family glycosyltransferase [Halorientalis pallida]|uniref:Phospholipid carrier-dependent glycosyltransferase n=1 Tax=Halorientalis pallida TaxID=2479928 RepID=A0A498KY93_9EURY|nr:glycosyltransferase family 39 protein [Halorientalis pallida]RXK46734.1 phospholipid carrier-dependent glycosyltransferase [Halorientalis pallida]
MIVASGPIERIGGQVRRDLRADPYLVVILLVAALLACFWVWHRVPNFVTWDERDRLLDSLVVYSSLIEDPSLASLRESVAWGRAPFGATFYLYTLAVLPVVVLALLLGEGGALAGVHSLNVEYGYFETWQATPAWIWTGSLVATRLVNACLAVGSVYLTYRLGTALRDRATGRLAAALLAVTFGLAMLAHEAGEDVPALFALLLALYLLVRSVQTGSRRRFLEASAAGGLAVAFKLTAGLIVPVIGLGYLLRARRDDRPLPDALRRPRLLVGGAATGAAVIALGFPTLLVGHVDLVIERFVGQSAGRAGVALGPDAPTWWWFLRGYLASFGLPLTAAGIAGVLASIAALRPGSGDRATASPTDRDARILLLALLAAFLAVLSGWHDVRPHHLLPTLPLVALLTADALARFRDRRPPLGGPLIAVLLVTTAAFAGVGVAGYATTPRDAATDWLDRTAPENATMATYHHGFDETAVPHRMSVAHRWGPASHEDRNVTCPEYVQLSYENLLYLRDVPPAQREAGVRRNVSRRAAYVRGLLEGDYAYEVAVEFGPRPPNYVPQRPTPGSLVDILPMGLTPRNDFYGDEQELGPGQYVVILVRDGACSKPVPAW